MVELQTTTPTGHEEWSRVRGSRGGHRRVPQRLHGESGDLPVGVLPVAAGRMWLAVVVVLDTEGDRAIGWVVLWLTVVVVIVGLC